MNNRFFNPHLAMSLRVTDMEKKILQISDGSQFPAMGDILEILTWMDAECDKIERRVNELQEEKTELEKRRKKLLSTPCVHEVLIGSMTLKELDLSAHSYNNLLRAGYLSVSEICKRTEQEFLESDKHITKIIVKEVKKELAKYGLSLECDEVESLDDEAKEDDSDDLQAELERAFDELFGPLDDEE